MLKERIFTIAGDNKGLLCLFKQITCPGGYCESSCPIYLDWQKQGEIIVICAWCGKEMGRKPGLGQTGVSHGICPECQQKWEGE